MFNRVLAVALFGFGFMLAAGSLGEIVLGAHPALLPPEALAIPFMAAHRTSMALRGWIVASNLVNLACAITFLRAAPGVVRDERRGWRRLRVAATVLAAVALAGLPICLRYFGSAGAGPMDAASTAMLVSVLAAGVGLAAACGVLVVVAGRALRRQATTPA